MINIGHIIVAFATVCIFYACGTEKGTGRIYMPDMTYSNAGETYAESKVPTKVKEGLDVEHNMNARLPVEGTVSRGSLPHDKALRLDEAYLMSYTFNRHFKPSEEDRVRAGAILQNPVANTKENLEEGKRLYTRYCAMCHGEKGDGQGRLVILPNGEDGPYTSVPPNYAEKLPELKDGSIFHTITYGIRKMGGYGSQLNPEQRWKVVNYIKSLAGIKQRVIDVKVKEIDLNNIGAIEQEVGASFNIPHIYFETGSAQLDRTSLHVLDKVAAYLAKSQKVLIEIGSHADARGDASANKTLSEQRAKSVVDYLISKGGTSKQIKAHGYGSEDLILDCGLDCSFAEHRLNRRTTIKALSVE